MHILRILAVLALCVPLQAEQKSSITQFGITWTFDKAYECGQFANGDWWVKGPVTVSSVSPAPSGGRNGSMVNPMPNTNAFDDRISNYDAGKGVSFPKVLQANQSLVSSISNITSDCMAGPHAGYSDGRGHCYLGKLKTAAVLTCVSAAKPSTAFRPPWCGSSYKPYFSTADIEWWRLPRLAGPASASTISGTDVLRDFERPWIDHFTNWTGRYLHPSLNLPDYGREIGYMVSKGALTLMLDKPETDQIAVRYIQLGIDNYGIVKAGGAWGADGGHLNGRKWPTVFAGMMLDDAAMKSPGSYANEDKMTYYNTAGKALWGRNCTSPYTATCSGSGSKDCKDPAELKDGCDDYRVCCTSPTWVGEVLAARIMRAEPLWNHDPLFDYVDRWMREGGLTASFTGQMWLMYRYNLPDPAGVVDAQRMLPAHAVAVSPNPMGDQITITVKDETSRPFSAEAAQGRRGVSTVVIYDHAGNMVWNRVVGAVHELPLQPVTWDGTNGSGQPVKPGVYFYRVTTPDGVASGRIIKTR